MNDVAAIETSAVAMANRYFFAICLMKLTNC